MATKTSIFCLYLIFVAVCLLRASESRCVDVPVEYCRRLGFTGTYFPNHFYHRSISEAVAAFQQFTAADGECSDDFGKFVCAAYFPGCTLANNRRVDIRFNPCRKLCNSVFKPCKLSFKRLKIKWPPELKCGLFPTKEGCTSVMDELVPRIPMPPTPTPTQSGTLCEPISYVECQNLGYDKTTMPNNFGQNTQEAAGAEVNHFKPLIGIQCSEALQTFVCASFFPPCSDNIVETPCRSLCEAAKDGCVQVMQSFGYEWPEHLRCSNLPNDTCFDGGFSGTNDSTAVQPSSTPVESQCEPLTIPLCQDLGYTSTRMPNMLGQSFQQDAQMTLQTFAPLLQSQCSPALKPFLCAAYAPSCSASTSQMPCRSLCETARDGCLPTLETFGFDWPETLNCSSLSNENCFSAQVKPQCEPLTISLCQDLGYTSTKMPNMLGQSFQQDAQMTLQTFTPLLQTQCSPALKPFLCAAYAPSCSASTSQMPCRSLCEAARDGCLPTLETFGIDWPETLNCSFLSNENCYDGGFSREIQKPASTLPTQVQSQCEPLTIPLCQALNYTSTMVPNMLGHSNQNDAMMEVNQFYPLITMQCSPALQPFLCALYAPDCSAESTQHIPCRSMCEMAKSGCLSVMNQFGFGWPESLNCSSFPNENCYDPDFSTEVQIPDGSCEDIFLPMCLNMSYSQTRFPNVLGHTSQYDALTAIIDNVNLVGCSPTMQPFLCSVYTPMCTADGSAKPCRSLCQQTMYECQQLLTLLNIKWPEELECSQFTDDDPSCMTDNTTASTVPTEVQSQCEPLKIPLCQNLGYTSTALPNYFGHSSQENAALEVHQFYPLIQIECSPALQPFLCSLYAPNCPVAGSTPQMPCRTLCEMAKGGCSQIMNQYGFSWPESLDCSSFSNENCYDAGFSSEVQKPDGSCEDIVLPMCLNMSYSQTRFPNVLGHTSQIVALTAIIDNVILVGCSPTMLPFLCSVYTPMCTVEGSAKPCRSLCQQTMYECQQLLTLLNIKWPEELECSQFTDEDPSCMTDNTTASTVPTEVQSQCEPLKIPLCQNLGYTSTALPNYFGHSSQENAALEVHQFYPLIQIECSPALQPFLCSLYAPNCPVAGSTPQMPCRTLCEMAKGGCSQIMNQYGFSWPESLDCSSFSNENCYDAGFSSEVQKPDGSCEDIVLPMCLNMSYSQTRFPNVLGHTSQIVALTAITDYVILVGCSPTMLPFLCSVYTPKCTAEGSAKPCRSLCQQTMYECQKLLTALNLEWPEELECSQFTDEDPSCNVNDTNSKKEVTMYTVETYIDGHAVDDRVVYNSNCEKIKSRRYDVTDMGLSEYFRGWVDVQGQGAANDYCRVVRGENGNLDLTCALAGTSGMTEFNYNITSLDNEKFVPGRHGEWYIRDENGDGRDDYCRCVYRDLDLYVSCIPAMAEGFVGNEEFRVEAEGCGVEQFNPFIGPRP